MNYTNYPSALDHHARTKPHEVAFRFLVSDTDIREISYETLAKNAKNIARNLLKTHQKGDRALLIFNPGLELIQAMIGCFYAGVIPLLHYPPTNQKLTDKISKIADNAGANLLISPSELLVKMKGFTFSKDMTYQEFEALEIPAQETILPDLTPQDIAFLQYTSGSTGDPKGVVILHETIMDNCKLIAEAFNFTTDKSQACGWLPPYHDMGLLCCLLMPLFAGKTSTLMTPMSFMMHPLKWLKAISRYRPTFSGGPNFAFDYCVERIKPEDKKDLDLSSWECVLNGGEPVSLTTLENFYENFKECGLKREFLFPCYGMAEITLMASANDLESGPVIADISLKALQDNKIMPPKDGNDAYKYVSSGKPRVPTYIVDPLTHTALKDDEIGEIWLSGKSKAAGYWQKPKETQETFHAHIKGIKGDFLRTGDLGFLRDGHLYVSGRLKDVIIVHGKNFYPQDLESLTVESHESIKSAGACAFSYEEDSQEKVCVVAEIQSKDPQLYYEIVKNIKENIWNSLELLVDRVVLIPTRALLKTTSGKVQRRKTKSMLETGELAVLYDSLKDLGKVTENVTQNTENFSTKPPKLSPKVKEILSHIESFLKEIPLSQGPLNPQSSWSSLGFDSLKSVRLCVFLSEKLNLEINPTLLWEQPVILDFCKVLSGEGSTDIPQDHEEFQNPQEDIAIIGMSCHFPKSRDVESFWNVLKNQENSITFIPNSRINFDEIYDSEPEHLGKSITNQAGLLEGIESFDAAFFSISPKEATVMDPQQRLLLQETYKALETSRLNPASLKDSKTSIMVGVSASDFSHILEKNALNEDLNAYFATGSSLSADAGRLAYFLGTKGEAMSLDTAC